MGSDDGFTSDLEGLGRQMRLNAEGFVQEAAQNIETYDRLRWYIAAECSHVSAIAKLLGHRERMIGDLVLRLQPLLPAPPSATPLGHPPPHQPQPQQAPLSAHQQQAVHPEEVEPPSAIGEIIRTMREQEAAERAGRYYPQPTDPRQPQQHYAPQQARGAGRYYE